MRKRRMPSRRRVDAMLCFIVFVLITMLFNRFSPATGGVEMVAEEPAPAEIAHVQMVAEEPVAEEVEASALPVASAGAPVRFLMHNVQNYFVIGEQQRSRYKLTPKKDASCEAVADIIADAKPEIVGLVEIGGPMALDDLAERLAARGLKYPHRKVLTREGEDRALALLSMHPIVEDNSRAEYGLFGTHNRKMLRGILDVTVKLPDKRRFRILGAHLKSHKGNTEDATNSLRTQEARTLALYIRDIIKKNPKLPLLVYGDWNDGPADSSLSILTQGVSKESALKRLKPEDSNGDTWTHYYKDGGQYLIYDQIYVNSVLGSRMGKKSKSGIVNIRTNAYGSDHRAVWCELR